MREKENVGKYHRKSEISRTKERKKGSTRANNRVRTLFVNGQNASNREGEFPFLSGGLILALESLLDNVPWTA